MKLIQLLAALVAFSLITVPRVRAQETETPTDKTSPTPAEKTETAKPDDEKKSETAKPDAEQAAAPVAKSAQKKETTARAAKPMARGSTAAELKSIEDKWTAAFLTHDVKAVDGILGDNYVLTDEKGKVFNRRGALKDFKKNTDTLEKANVSDVVVHPINSDAAVVTGMSHEIGKEKGGKSFDRTFRWTDTFVNRNGKWECVASHVTLVAQK